jgi:hypothetical protein
MYQPQCSYEGVSKSFRTGRLERGLQIVQLSATRCSCIGILWVSLVSFAAITLCVASQRVVFRYRLSPETFRYTLVRRVWYASTRTWGCLLSRPDLHRHTVFQKSHFRNHGHLLQLCYMFGFLSLGHFVIKLAGVLFFFRRNSFRIFFGWSTSLSAIQMCHMF